MHIPEDAGDVVSAGGDDAVPVHAAHDVARSQSRPQRQSTGLHAAHGARTSSGQCQSVGTITSRRPGFAVLPP